MVDTKETRILTPVPIERVTIDDEFWAPKMETWRAVTLRDAFRKFEEMQGGALNNFDKVRLGRKGGHAAFPWTDGLIYEMIRAASDFLRGQPDPALDKQLDGYIDRIVAAAAVDPDGYLNTYTQLEEPNHRWGLNGGLEVWQHELYNLGALVEAAVHHTRATGKTTLLGAAVKIANHMASFIGPAPKTNMVPSHELPEEAMLGLYELFVEKPDLKAKIPHPVEEGQYRALAEFWIEYRGRHSGKPEWTANRAEAEKQIRNFDYAQGRPSWGAYAQDHVPIFEQTEAVGHAVRATLLYSAVAAMARVNGSERYRDTAVRLWENMVFRRMHITGGVGAYSEEEKFGPDYLLPNDAYLETCAAVGAGFFHANMNRSFGHARYADELERTLFNGILCGVSVKGDSYFYMNPLVSDERRRRWEWHDCPCCPPMFLKIMGALPGYIYATDADSLYVNLYVGGHAETTVNGTAVKIEQRTKYPWDGAVRLTLNPAQVAEFGLMVRVPAWCTDASVKVNGQKVSVTDRVRGYVRIARRWQAGDVVELNLPMPVKMVESHPKVTANLGRVAIMRGPLVYCVESEDNQEQAEIVAIRNRPDFETEFWTEQLGGVVAIEGTAIGEAPESWSASLYASGPLPEGGKPHRFRAIPYYANTNRGPSNMIVWIPRER
jgi:DUF1680 family protein